MSDPEIRWVGELQRCDVKPGDKFVLTIPRPITCEQTERFQALWKSFIGDDSKLLIIEEGMKLGVFGASDEI